jgi:hypothetical protein
MTTRRHARLALTALMAGTLLVTGSVAGASAGSGHGAPVIERAPAHPPTMTRTHGNCVDPTRRSDAPSANSGKPLVWVHAHPTGFVAIWIPGLNAKRCVARRTTSGAHLAERLAAAIRHAKPFPNEPLPCPYDDGTSVRVYFIYSHGGDEYAEVALAGCRPISAPGRASRWSDAAVERPLHKAAPPAWRPYLAG